MGGDGATKAASYEDLSPKARRRLLIKPLFRSLLSAVLLVVIYYWLPLDGNLEADAAVVLVLGLCAFTALLALQVRSITRAPAPRLRAIEVLFTTLPFFLLVFATVYYLMARGAAGSFSEALNRTDALYFTITVFSTVGFGDIAPVTQPARVVAMIQMLGDLFVLGVGLKLLLGAVQMGLKRRSADSQGAAAPDASAPANDPGLSAGAGTP